MSSASISASARGQRFCSLGPGSWSGGGAVTVGRVSGGSGGRLGAGGSGGIVGNGSAVARGGAFAAGGALPTGGVLGATGTGSRGVPAGFDGGATAGLLGLDAAGGGRAGAPAWALSSAEAL